jgi:imidazolonepropionase-like amidohydrolase
MLKAIKAGTLIDGNGAKFDAATIVVENGLIREIATDGKSPPINGNAEWLDYSDLTVLPGLIDGHVHIVFSAGESALNDILTDSNERAMLRAVHNVQAALSVGVTTVRDVGGITDVTLALRDAIRDGIVPGPRILAAGPAITITGGHCYFLGGEADGIEAVRHKARDLAKRGVDLFKVMATGGGMTPGTNTTRAQFTVEELEALVGEAHRRHLKVAAHAHGVAGIRNAVTAGVNTIEHCTWVREDDLDSIDFDENVAKMMAAKGVFMSPTLCPSWLNLNRPAGGEMTPNRVRMRRLAPLIKEAKVKALALGVEPMGGTDAGVSNVPLDSMPIEIRCLVEELELTPMQAIVASTRNGSRALGIDGEVGTVDVGKRADLLVVEGDPSADILNVGKTRWVLRDGNVLVENGRLVRT